MLTTYERSLIQILSIGGLTKYERQVIRILAIGGHLLYGMLAHAQFVVTDYDAGAALASANASPQFVVTDVSTIPTLAVAAPTPVAEVIRVLALLPKPEIGFVDFGCGADARWCVAAAEKWGPNVRVTGVEIDPGRAAAARERVQVAGLADRVTIITGDVLTTDVTADVGVAYLYSDVLEKLKPRLEKLKAFASYMHRPPWMPVVKNGDSWLYVRPVQPVLARPTAAVWGGQLYSHPQCNDPRCEMCNAIRLQLAAPVAVQPKAVSGHYVKRCNGRQCWMEWVRD